VGETAKKTVLAALLVWLLTRVLQRLVGVALIAAVLAGALTVASGHGVDAGRAGRVVQCEARAIARAAKQLRNASSNDSPAAAQRQLQTLRRVGRCDRQKARSSAQRDRNRP
jgi:hypothetical protein